MIQIVILGIAAAIAFGSGFKVAGWRHDSAMLAVQAKVADHRKTIDDKQAEMEVLNAENIVLQNRKEKIITREVVRYEPLVNMGVEWVRIHNCAAMPAASATTCEPDDSPGRVVTDRDALITITQNYDLCQADLLRFEGLQQWVSALYIED